MTVQKWGSQFDVASTHGFGVESAPAVTGLVDGGFVFAWQVSSSNPADGAVPGIRAHRYDIAGGATNADFAVRTGSQFFGTISSGVGRYTDPSIVGTADGGFEVGYQAFSSTRIESTFTVTQQAGIDFFDASGARTGSGSSPSTGSPTEPDVGDHALAYVAAGNIGLTRFPATGPASAVITSNGANTAPDVLRLQNTNLAIAWTHAGAEIRLDVVDSNGALVTPTEVLVNTTAIVNPSNNPIAPHLAKVDSGFVAVWAQDAGSGSGYDIRARLFDGSGNPLGADFVVNTTAAGTQNAPEVFARPNGSFGVVWYDAAGSQIVGRLFDAAGAAQSPEFQVVASLTYSDGGFGTGGLQHLSTSSSPDGRFVVTWDDGSKVHAQVFDPRDGIVNGTADNDRLAGSFGADVIDGKAGADTMFGLTGDDWYFVDDPGDAVVERAGEGTQDRVFASANYSLTPGAQIEILSTDFHAGTTPLALTGNELAQMIFGNAGDNTLDDGGAANPDTLIGNGGNDVFMVSNALDQIVEAADGSFDRVYARISFALPSGQEIEQLSTSLHAGTAPINLTGNEFANAIYGNAGDNTLDDGGAANPDTLIGNGGNDTYLVSNSADLIVETADGSFDRVYARVDYKLPSGQEIEQLSTSLHAGTAPIRLTGNEFANVLYGNAGDNVLDDGGAQNPDTMIGNGGNDFYFVTNAGDQVVEAVGGGGADRVFARVSYNLSAGAEVEIMSTSLHAGTEAINLRGNEFANTIYGNAGTNVLVGRDGNDTLWGFDGADYFLFETAPDSVNNFDTIGDFTPGVDKIVLLASMFPGLAPGPLASGAFFAGPQAHDDDDRIIYDSRTGNLFFDPDGVGGDVHTKFAKVAPGLALSEADFSVL